MTDKQAYKIIADRVQELVKRDDVKEKMVNIAKTEGKAKAESFVYKLAIATLIN